jgi:hypothetical protein
VSFLVTESGQSLLTESGEEILVELAVAPPLQTIIPSYLYEQYSDDADLNAFVASFNALAQSYLDWFNATPLGVYTNPNIAGSLLDWIATGVYGIARPVFSSQTTRYIAGFNSSALNARAVNGQQYFQSGTATIATDDYYKRVLTWWLYAGTSRRFNATLLRLKVARFLFGVNGTDVTLAQAQAVHIQPGPVAPPGAPALSDPVAGGTFAARTYGARASYVTPVGEGLAGGASSLTVPFDFLLRAASPPAANGAIGWNVYVGILSTNPGKFIAGMNSQPVNAMAVNGTNKKGVGPLSRQNVAPIPIGTNWDEPTSGLIAGLPLPTQDASNTPGNFIVTIPRGTAATVFQQAFAQGSLAFPFQLSATVVVT